MSTAGSGDGDLVVRARDGDARAWESLVDRLASRVWAVARAHRLSPADADDVSQITFMRLWTHLRSIREPDRVGAWVASTARHESLRVLKRAGRQIPTGDDEDFEGADTLAPPPEARLVASERQLEVWDALAELPAPCQRLLRLLMADPPPSYDEITIALGMPQGSIGPTRRRCLDKLRQRLESRSVPEEGVTR